MLDVNETEMLAALKAARQDFDQRGGVLKSKIARAQRVIQRSEMRLLKLGEGFAKRVRELTDSYVNLPDAEHREPAVRKRKARWSLDEPVLKFIRSMTAPIVTVPLVTDEWNREHPDEDVGVTTMRGVMSRLVGDGRLEIVDQGGPGRAKATEYRVAPSGTDQEQEANIVAH